MTELVGKMTLKEIVAQTADVIEKVCIEAAIELTDNNRVAAADMLGLSRQSLYVKLRKHDIL
jgi:Response regulator containing CheY-like receiver, AAA-type ATPase, and DNA-binding domains